MAGATKCYRVTPDHDSNMQRELVSNAITNVPATAYTGGGRFAFWRERRV
mgnify:CR=1 FL=1